MMRFHPNPVRCIIPAISLSLIMWVIGVTEKVVLFALLPFLAPAAADGESKTLFSRHELLVEEKLKLINKPAIKSIQSRDGDIIDCVDIHKQPAFDHPLLKNHIIKMSPSDEGPFSGKNKKSKKKKRDAVSPSSTSSAGRRIRGGGEQTWRRSGSCPNGTVPILRVQKHHLLNSPTSIFNYGRKPSINYAAAAAAAAATGNRRQFQLISNGTEENVGIEGLHATAVLVASAYNFIGAQASICIYNPRVEGDDEFSSGQIWLTNGPFNDSDSIEAGWMVNPSVFGDKRVRFFAYWTIDSGKKTGCFNLICAGFVQTSGKIVLGGTFSGVSIIEGAQYEFWTSVWKDFRYERWWLMYDDITVGYWPAELFRNMEKTATLVLFGGDVYSPRIKETPHTSTAMGSGEYSIYHYGNAAFIRQPRTAGFAGVYRYPYPFGIWANQIYCYNGENYADIIWTEPLFYFGGPGKNLLCP